MSDLRHPLEIEGAAARGPSCTNPNVGRMHVSRRRALSRSGGVIAVLTASLSVASCSGDAPVPEPTPLVYTFSFGTSAQTGRPYSMWLEDARERVTNQLAVVVMADFEEQCLVDRIQGTLTYDAGVLEAESHTEGTFMRQGGVEPQTTVTYRRGSITFLIDRPGSVDADGVSGRADVITVRFRAAGPAARGSSSPLQWVEPHAYTVRFFECLHVTQDAEVSVR